MGSWGEPRGATDEQVGPLERVKADELSAAVGEFLEKRTTGNEEAMARARDAYVDAR